MTKDNEKSKSSDSRKREGFSKSIKEKVIDTIPPPSEESEDKAPKKQAELLDKEKYKLLFGVRRSIRYHNRRILFYEHIHKMATAFALLSGSATVIAVLGKMGAFWTTSFALIVVIFSAIDLVVGPDKAARMHNGLARKFFNLEKSIITEKNITEETLAYFSAERLDIEMNEPPIKKVLDSMCHNELCRAMGIEEYSVKIKWYQRIFCQFFDFCEYTIKAS